MPGHTQLRLSLPEAERSLYLDFKGFRDTEPAIVGLAMDGAFEAIVTDARFGDAALARDLRVQHFAQLLGEAFERARNESRAIVCFSSNDLDQIDRYTCLGPAVAEICVTAQANAEPQVSLAEQLAKLGRPLPRRLGPRHTTPRLRYVEKQLLRHDAYTAITPTAKAKWTKLVQQCRSDCFGLRELTLTLAGGSGAAQHGDIP